MHSSPRGWLVEPLNSDPSRLICPNSILWVENRPRVTNIQVEWATQFTRWLLPHSDILCNNETLNIQGTLTIIMNVNDALALDAIHALVKQCGRKLHDNNIMSTRIENVCVCLPQPCICGWLVSVPRYCMCWCVGLGLWRYWRQVFQVASQQL